MSKRCGKTTGGLHEIPSSDNSDKKLSVITQPETERKHNLRPRPTRQTDHFRSPSQLKPKKTLSCTSVSSVSGLYSSTDICDISPKRFRAEDSSDTLGRPVTTDQDFKPEIKKLKKTTHPNKLWYPFIAPQHSSDSDEEDSSALTKKSALHANKRNLASRCPKKDTSQKPGAESNPAVAQTVSDISLTSKSSEKADKSKIKSGGRIHIGSRYSLSAPSLTKSGKSKKPVDEAGGKTKAKRYLLSNPTEVDCSKDTNTGKTGSCASTSLLCSRKARGKRAQPQPHDTSSSNSTSPRGSEAAPASQVVATTASSASRVTVGSSRGGTAVPANDAAPPVVGSKSAEPQRSEPNTPGDAGSESMQTNALAADSDHDESDMSRLQALLEARGLPSNIFGSLGPRMQQIFHRPSNTGASSKAHNLVEGMQANGDESRQLQSVIEMCQLLVMGNEDTLSGFPIRLVVPALNSLLKMEHNFDMMNHACRALSYMMEALPRSSAIIVESVPILLEKLQSIQCMDVAEQSLTALEMLSRQHSQAILKADGLASCLLYLDFFSLSAQRNALAVAANCCCATASLREPRHDFDKYFAASVPLLVQRLAHHDKKCLESICLCFARLVDNHRFEVETLRKLGNQQLLENFQNLLVMTPPTIGSNTFVMVIRTMCLMCSPCPDLATRLVRNNIAETLQYLLCGNTHAATVDGNRQQAAELLPRSPQELFEITALIRELMPKLPLNETVFSVDKLLKNASSTCLASKHVWQWRSDDSQWVAYSKADNRKIDDASANGEQEVNLLINGRVYTIDFTIMHQVNEDSGFTRAVRKVADTSVSNVDVSIKQEAVDESRQLSKEDSAVISQFVRSLSTLLYEVYGSSAGSPSVRHNCLHALKRMIYYADAEVLRDILKDLSLSSHIASMLSSTSLEVVVGALQMAILLMSKLPAVFEVYFQRQGVVYQISQLLDPDNKVVGSSYDEADTMSQGAESDFTMGTEIDVHAARYDIGKEKRYFQRSAKKKFMSSQRGSQSQHDSLSKTGRSKSLGSDRVISPPLSKAKAFAAAAMSTVESSDAGKSKSVAKGERSASSFFLNLNPAQWGKIAPSTNQPTGGGGKKAPSPPITNALLEAASAAGKRSAASGAEMHKLSSTKRQETTRKIKAWVCEQARMFLEKHFPAALGTPDTAFGTDRSPHNSKDSSLLAQLTSAAESLHSTNDVASGCASLTLLSAVVTSSDASPFELEHSGIIGALLRFLAAKPFGTGGGAFAMTTRRKASELGHDETPAATDAEKRDDDAESKSMTQDDKLRCFLHVFGGLPLSYFHTDPIESSDLNDSTPMRELVRKLNLCVNHLEQFPVKLHDISSAGGNRSEALNFFARHQLKCQLQRHPSSSKLKQWHGGAVRVDPLALVQAVEKYLVSRGYSAVSGSSSDDADHKDPLVMMGDDDSDDEIEDGASYEIQIPIQSNAVPGSKSNRTSSVSSTQAHKLELYINDQLLPYNMTVYQAVKSFSRDQSSATSGSVTDERYFDEMLPSSESSSSLWNTTHVIHYKYVPLDAKSSGSHSRKSHKSSARSSKKSNFSWSSGKVSTRSRRVDDYVSGKLPINSLTNDPCKEVLCLLKVLFGISRYWHMLYSPTTVNTDQPLIPTAEFVNNKLSAKCTRQILDPVVIMTGEIPSWVGELTHACPFVLPFEARQLVFRIITFDRDRAMHYLLDSGRMLDTVVSSTAAAAAASSSSYSHHDHGSRFTSSKVEKKKYVIKRDNLLQQAEKLMQDHGHQRAIIEVQYDGEVGTGLGPTQEFYTLAGHELQRCEMQMWRDDGCERKDGTSSENRDEKLFKSSKEEISEIDDDDGSDNTVVTQVVEPPLDARDESVRYVTSQAGLFPRPIGKVGGKGGGQPNKVVAKFRFLGRLLAKALMDNRLVDVPLSVVFFKWLLGLEDAITWMDLQQVDPGMSRTFSKLKSVLHQRQLLEQEAPKQTNTEEKILQLTIDGCSVEDLELDFLLPGFPNIELMKSGSKTNLTITNLDKYLSLIAFWTLHEGVKQQMEAVRSGFQQIFSLQTLDYFFPEELDQLFCGARYQIWSEQELADACKTDHGYTLESETVKFLFQVLSRFDATEQRRFLQFVTGSPHLPIGGLRAMNPPLTLVRKTCEDGRSPDEYLPSVMTCVNYLKIPEYSSQHVLEQRFRKAVLEGQQSFLLS